VALSQWRSFVSLTLLAFLPVSLFADDSAAAVLRSTSGAVLVNQSAAPPSIAVFRGDIIETRPGSLALMEYRGSSVEIGPETIIRLEEGEIILDHGSVTVTSFQQLRVRAGCVLATPVGADKTIYFVKDIDGRVTVFAKEKDVNLDSHTSDLKRASQPGSSGHDIVHQDEQKSRNEHCGDGDLPHTAATDGVLNSPLVLAPVAALVIAGIACVLLCFGDNPASPSSPSHSTVTSNHP
jgi:hypothetical protein